MKQKQLTFLLIGNGSPVNGGCEAISKGTIAILKTVFPDCLCIDCFYDYSGVYQKDIKTAQYPISYPKRWTCKWLLLQLSVRLSYSLTSFLLFHSHRKLIKQSNIILSVGGDNYSLDYGIPRRFIAMGKYIKKQQIPFVIWGASIGPFTKGSLFEKEMVQHLKEDVDLIFTREEESKHYLSSLTINNNVQITADPAFIMTPEECLSKLTFPLPLHYICVNFSDLMAKYVTNGNMSEWITICAHTIDLLVNESKLPLLFIPHVESDYNFAMQILPRTTCSDRVILLNKNLNAAEMKWIISKAECNIACRTHATIASFSTSVPTISLGYSIKSKGLNIQMYGHERYLIYQQDITSERILHVYKDITSNQISVRQLLTDRNETVKEQAMSAGVLLKHLLKKQ